MTKRLFIALELPESCKKILVELNPRIKGVRWLPAEQIHLTMSFLGEVEASNEERLRDALRDVDVPPFFLPVHGIGTFGGARPTVVWAGVGQGHPHLFAAHKHIQDAVLRAGLEPDLRPFHPHITVARAQGLSRATLKQFLTKYAETEFALWKVTGFALFSSVLSREGAAHHIEMRREFSPGHSEAR
jgi:2'-5' RNA ligase